MSQSGITPKSVPAASRVAFNTGLLVAGSVLGRLLSLITLPLLARYLGPEAFGTYSLVLIHVGVFTALADFGVDGIVLRELARGRNGGAELLGNAVVLKLGLAFGAMLVAIAAAAVLRYPPDMQLMITLYSATLLCSFSTIFAAPSAAAQVIYPRIGMRFGVQVLVVVLIVAVIVLHGSMVHLILVHVLGALLTAATFMLLARQQPYQRPSYRLQPGLLWYLLREATPVAFSNLLAVSVSRVGILLLGWLQGGAAVGYYAAGFRLTEPLRVVPLAVAGAMFPAVSNLNARLPQASASLVRSAIKLLVLMILPVAVGTTVLVEPIITTVLSPRYLPAAPALVLLVWAQGFVFVNHVFGSAGTATGRQRLVVTIMAVAAVVHIGINLLLIPREGFVGAAVAVMVTQTLIFSLYLLTLGRRFRLLLSLAEIGKAFLALVVMGLLVGFLWRWMPHLWLVVPTGAGIYAVGLLLLRVVTIGQLRSLIMREVQA